MESEHAREILETMIIPQLEEDRHGAEVAGMMFFFDNAYMLVEGCDICRQAAGDKREDRHAAYGLRPLLLSEGHWRMLSSGRNRLFP